jgi:predicted nucleotidyltransferase
MNENEIEIIINDFLEYSKEDPEILAVILYGSYARGESFHDIDLCLFTYNSFNDIARKLDYRIGHDSILDVHFFDDLPIYIQAEVLNDGKILLNKDYDVLCDIYLKTIRNYSDFKPRLNLMLED